MNTQPWFTPEAIAQVQLILDNYCHWFKTELISRESSPEQQAKNLFEAPFVVLSHDTAADPVYTYGNQTALDLWERTWAELLQMPSRQSAESFNEAQTTRNQILRDSRALGFQAGFSGIRVRKSGQRIKIEDVKLWDLLDAAGEYRGQAAVFSKWTFLD
ncbi:MAG: MEKHLA domain-containing protein [Synechococcus sp.]|nr:MEKHLA domain-containing protein [Synechococcus sp.]